MNNIHIIAFVGPPSCGKSAVWEILQKMEHSDKVNLVFIPEVATAVMWDWPSFIQEHDDPVVRQYYIYKTQLLLEDLGYAFVTNTTKETLIVTDRGALDMYAYLAPKELELITTQDQRNELRGRYDTVFYFDTIGYLAANNPSRREQDYSEIVRLDERSKWAWETHCNAKIVYIPPHETIDDKARTVAEHINAVVGKEVFLL